MLQLTISPALGDASVTSITEYLLTQPILSFTMVGVTRAPVSPEQGDSSEGESEEEEEEGGGGSVAAGFDSRRNAVLLKLHCVHTRCVVVCCCLLLLLWLNEWDQLFKMKVQLVTLPPCDSEINSTASFPTFA